MALACGEWDVTGMLQTMTWSQLLDWWHFYQVWPFGELRADLRAGIVASSVLNSQRGRNSPIVKPADMMPDFTRAAAKSAARGERKPMDASGFQRLKAMMKAYAGGGKKPAKAHTLQDSGEARSPMQRRVRKGVT